MGRSLITFDSPWQEICEAARSAPWGKACDQRPSSLQRKPFSDAELTGLAGIPVLVLHDHQLPMHPANDGLLVSGTPEYEELVAQRAEKALELLKQGGDAFAPLAQPDISRTIAVQKDPWLYTSYMRLGDVDAPSVRSKPVPDLNGPLPHRLSGKFAANVAIILTDCEHMTQPFVISCAERQLWLPGQDFKIMSEGRMLMHLLQLRPDAQDRSLQNNVLAGRDAENGSLALYQTAFGGPASHAAARIVSHVSGQFQLTPDHGFWPGQAPSEYRRGNSSVTALRLFALYNHAGVAAPDWKTLEEAADFRTQGWSPSVAALVFGKQFSAINAFATGYVKKRGLGGMLEDTLLGLRDFARRDFEALPQHIQPLARQLTDAATFTNPGLMGFDPVKPRISFFARKHLAPA